MAVPGHLGTVRVQSAMIEDSSRAITHWHLYTHIYRNMRDHTSPSYLPTFFFSSSGMAAKNELEQMGMSDMTETNRIELTLQAALRKADRRRGSQVGVWGTCRRDLCACPLCHCIGICNIVSVSVRQRIPQDRIPHYCAPTQQALADLKKMAQEEIKAGILLPAL